MHIHWSKTLDAFENQHRSSSLNMRMITRLLIFAFWSLLRLFFKLELSNLVRLGHLTHSLTSVPGLFDNKKLYFCRFFMHILNKVKTLLRLILKSLIFMHGYLWKIWNRWGKIWWMNVYKNENKNASTSPNIGKYVQCYFFFTSKSWSIL